MKLPAMTPDQLVIRVNTACFVVAAAETDDEVHLDTIALINLADMIARLHATSQGRARVRGAEFQLVDSALFAELMKAVVVPVSEIPRGVAVEEDALVVITHQDHTLAWIDPFQPMWRGNRDLVMRSAMYYGPQHDIDRMHPHHPPPWCSDRMMLCDVIANIERPPRP